MRGRGGEGGRVRRRVDRLGRSVLGESLGGGGEAVGQAGVGLIRFLPKLFNVIIEYYTFFEIVLDTVML